MPIEHADLTAMCKEKLVGKVDGDDIFKIMWRLDDLAFPEFAWDGLIEVLGETCNTLYVLGCDYGSDRDWDEAVLNIVETYINGFTVNKDNVSKLFDLITA